MYDPADVILPRRRKDEIESKPSDYRWRLERFRKAWKYHPTEMPERYIREIIAHTYGMVSMLDYHIGRILDHLDELKLSDDTVIMFSTDHGEHLGDHWLIYKCAPYDECTHIPMIWRCPARFASGIRQEGFVGLFDAAPTIIELAGCDIPRGVQASSFSGALTQSNWQGRDWVLQEDDDVDLEKDLRILPVVRTLHTPRYRITNYFYRGDGELYDLEEDPNEFRNLWDDPAYRNVKNELTEVMLQAVSQAVDPKPARVAPS
jgi:arylsulfatase A-like enzyme